MGRGGGKGFAPQEKVVVVSAGHCAHSTVGTWASGIIGNIVPVRITLYRSGEGQDWGKRGDERTLSPGSERSAMFLCSKVECQVEHLRVRAGLFSPVGALRLAEGRRPLARNQVDPIDGILPSARRHVLVVCTVCTGSEKHRKVGQCEDAEDCLMKCMRACGARPDWQQDPERSKHRPRGQQQAGPG